MKNFKLFDIGERQVLVERGSTEEDGEHFLCATYTDGIRAEMKFGYTDKSEDVNKELADEAFNGFNEIKAQEFLRQIDEAIRLED